MILQKIPIADLIEDPANARAHGAKNVRAVKGSLKRFKQQRPILIDKNNVVIAGNCTLGQARELGWKEIWAIRSDLEGAEAMAYGLVDNRSGELAHWADDILNKTLKALDADGWDLPELGWEDDDWMKPKPAAEPSPPPVDPDEPPIPAKAPRRVEPGQVWQLGRHRLVCGNSGDVAVAALIRGQSDAHALVSDPPYGLAFMGKAWDYDVPKTPLWQLWIEALAPGAHLLVFGGTRTYHRMVVALEDAGVEIRDQMQWLYGSGFPKSHDVSKAIDKEAGAERDKVRHNKPRNPKSIHSGEGIEGGDRPCLIEARARGYIEMDGPIPATAAAAAWDGWGTALKPANEPICVARKPISEETVAANVLKHGTGGINVDGCRIGTDMISTHGNGDKLARIKTGRSAGAGEYREHVGRFPSNLVLSHSPECRQVGTREVKATAPGGKPTRGASNDGDKYGAGKTNGTVDYGRDGAETVEAWDCAEGCAVRLLDEQSGQSPSNARTDKGSGMGFHGAAGERGAAGHADTGGASRFFYCAKSSRSDRGEGNAHPTVKPLRLMEYLVRLVTAEGQTVLEPFAGSGTTLLACETTGRRCLAAELDPVHCDIVLARWEAMTGQRAELAGGDHAAPVEPVAGAATASPAPAASEASRIAPPSPSPLLKKRSRHKKAKSSGKRPRK